MNRTKTKATENNNGYFEALPKSTQELVREALIEAAENRSEPKGWKPDDECIESIECVSRDGFIPFSHNRGGLTYRNFTDLMSYYGSGHRCNHAEADKEIEKQIEYSLKLASEATFEKFKSIMEARKITKEECTYCNLEELEKKFPELNKAVQYIQEAELECLGDSDSSIMHEFRFMYHGEINGIHHASVSTAINTEGPYHRTHISWAPNVFCEGSKEIEITWRTESGLKRKLIKVLAMASKEIF